MFAAGVGGSNTAQYSRIDVALILSLAGLRHGVLCRQGIDPDSHGHTRSDCTPRPVHASPPSGDK